ncbi:BMP family lipoprotein [Pararhodospirillum oryzae]|uniref:Twin-arginine translocation pathway signal protein n=1 Tax=Pararhodospirillum oryzae TaxID=478448 RepID=A0A512H3C3_9PROT|nr:BMP family ABC transporter substrate-binding protein [Pararhodospirillum oryzae]GEO79954.1 twin-arginine translocation pathway signal protein [Pararhodospirillum oryzae]
MEWDRRTFLALLGSLPAGLWFRGARADGVEPRGRSQNVVRPRIAVVYGRSEAGKFDKGFNQLAFAGLEAACAGADVVVREFEPVGPGEEASMIVQAATEADLVVTVGWGLHVAAKEASRLSPSTRFSVIDAVVEQPRFQSLVFRENEGAFLAGYLAAEISSTRTIGFVGALSTPVIERFRAGYRGGAFHADPTLTVRETYIGTTGEAYHDPFKGLLAAERLIEQGADILFAAAGRSGLGVYQAAADHGVFAIGVDANQNFLHPGTMLTSVVKRVDTAVQRAVGSLIAGTWREGVVSLGLKEEGMRLALDGYNHDLIGEANWAKVEALRTQLIAGAVKAPASVGE